MIENARQEHYLELKEMSLNKKIEWAQFRIKEFLEWCCNNNYKEALISFSGGKDSTVLLDLVLKTHKSMNSKIDLIPSYAMEITFPETIKFIKTTIEKYQKTYEHLKKLYFVPPKKSWKEILNRYGYPAFSKQISNNFFKITNANTKNNALLYAFGIKPSAMFKISKDRLFMLDKNYVGYTIAEKCCDHIKGGLKHDKRPSFVGIMADESQLRKKSWIEKGCNILDETKPMSRPLSLWDSNNVWEYIKLNQIEVNQAYGYDKTQHNVNNLRFERLGCSACPFGIQFEEKVKSKHFEFKNRFEKLYEYNLPLYKQQVIKTGIYIVLADMKVTIRNDLWYMDFYNERIKLRENWYKNFRNNFILLMLKLENNGKNKNGWTWTLEEINKALSFYGEEKLTNEEYLVIRSNFLSNNFKK